MSTMRVCVVNSMMFFLSSAENVWGTHAFAHVFASTAALKPFAAIERREILQSNNGGLGHYGKGDEALCILPDAEFLDLLYYISV